MAVGFFIGIRGSYVDDAMDCAEAFLDAINVTLRGQGLAEYVEPRSLPDVYVGNRFGRSSLDHIGASSLRRVAQLAGEAGECPELGLIAANPYRVAFVPTELGRPLLTKYVEKIAGSKVRIWVGSVSGLLRDLAVAASALNVPLERGRLADPTAEGIDQYGPLFEGDDDTFGEERKAWLVMNEGARLATENGLALCLAG